MTTYRELRNLMPAEQGWRVLEGWIDEKDCFQKREFAVIGWVIMRKLELIEKQDGLDDVLIASQLRPENDDEADILVYDDADGWAVPASEVTHHAHGVVEIFPPGSSVLPELEHRVRAHAKLLQELKQKK